MPIWPAFKQSPLEALPVAKLRDPPHCTVGNADLSLEPPFPISSGKLVYAAEWMRKKQKYFSGGGGEEEAEKRFKEEVFIFERRREEVT